MGAKRRITLIVMNELVWFRFHCCLVPHVTSDS
jgi:hypothetical protein